MDSKRTSSRSIIDIEVNGVHYERLEDVPTEYRIYLEDKNGNGIPDFIESAPEGVKKVVRVEKRVVHSGELSESEIRRLLSNTKIHHGVHREGSWDHINLGNIVAHLHGMLSTLLLAFGLAIVMIVIFVFWILPRFI